MAQPARLGRYEVLEPIGRGAMGAVYRGRDPAIDRIVAIKTIAPGLLESQRRGEFLDRFLQEARAAGRLSHPAIVSVHDVGVDETTATPYIVMEYVSGVSLATVLEENPRMPVDQALEIVEQIGAALDEAHQHGIVHRDIKPANVFLDTRGRVKVGDFGIARARGGERPHAHGMLLGTPGYIAPEVLEGRRSDARSDVFSLGVVAYWLLAGRSPFDAGSREALAMQVLQDTPPPPRAVRPEVPAAASRAVMHALAKAPDERAPSVAWFLAELSGPGAAAPPAGRSRRAVLVAVGAAVAGALALGGTLLALRKRGR